MLAGAGIRRIALRGELALGPRALALDVLLELGAELAIIEPIGIAIASPSTHRQLPMMCSWTEAMMSRSIGVASPVAIRSSIFTVQFVPSRHGVHLPQDSCGRTSRPSSATSRIGVESSTTMIAPEPSIEPALASESKS